MAGVVAECDGAFGKRQAVAADGPADAAAGERRAGCRRRAVVDLGGRAADGRRGRRHRKRRDFGSDAGAAGTEGVVAGHRAVASSGDPADAQARHRDAGGFGNVSVVVGHAGVTQRDGGAGVARHQPGEAIGRRKTARRIGGAVVDLGHAAVGHGRRQRGRRDCRTDAGAGGDQVIVGGQRAVAAGDGGEVQARCRQGGGANDVRAVVGCAAVGDGAACVAGHQAGEGVGRRESGRRGGRAVVGLGHTAIVQRHRQRRSVDRQRAVGIGNQVAELSRIQARWRDHITGAGVPGGLRRSRIGQRTGQRGRDRCAV